MLEKDYLDDLSLIEREILRINEDEEDEKRRVSNFLSTELATLQRAEETIERTSGKICDVHCKQDTGTLSS